MRNNEKKAYFAKVAGKRVPAALEAIRAMKDAQKAVRSTICMVTETTISGSGGYDDCAQVLIRVCGQMDGEKKEELAAELARIKCNSSAECLDTDEMVADACNKVFGEGNWELLDYNEVVF